MNKKLVSLAITILLPITALFAQEEFLKDENGISAYVSIGKQLKATAFTSEGISAQFKSGLGFGLGYTNQQNISYPTAYLSYHVFTERIKPFNLFTIALQAAQYEKIRLGAFNFLVGRHFQYSEDFQFAISAGVSYEMLISDLQENINPAMPVIGINYTQALYPTNKIYPFFGLTYSMEMQDFNKFVSLFGGLTFTFQHKNN